MSDAKKDNWEKEAKKWANQADNPSNYFTRRSVIIADLLARHATGGSALDVGCGSGLLSYLLAVRGFDVYGTDLSENMIAESVQRVSAVCDSAKEHFCPCKDGDVPFADKKFDIITAIDVLQYIEDWPSYLSKLSGILNDNGLFLMTSTNRRGLFSLGSIVYQFFRLPVERHDLKKWRATLMNLVHTGYWSGGFIDCERSKQCYKARCVDTMLDNAGFIKVDEIGLYDHPRFLDRKVLDRTRPGRYLVRHMGWNYLGVYRKRPTTRSSSDAWT